MTPRPTPSAAPDVVVDVAHPLADGPIPYGVNGWWTDQDAEMWRARYAELAPRIVRLPVMHGALEPVNDDDDPGHVRWAGFGFDQPIPWFGRTITYRRWFETLRDLDVTIMLHVPHLAGWLSANGDQGLNSTYPPRSMEEYSEFLSATLTYLVEELDYPPERIILEPVNEPDLRCGQDPAVPCFWDRWTMEELVDVIHTARAAADAVDPAIRLVGLSTCCDPALVEELMRDHRGHTLLDGLTYHRYEPGFDQGRAVAVGQRLADWGLPVYINEYGSPRFWSNGEEGALWHALALAQFWPAGIAPVEFSMSEIPGMHEGYNELGLLSDWEAGWVPKPAYAVYVSFFHHLGPTTPISVTAQQPLVVAAGRRDEDGVALWVINASQEDRPAAVFQVLGTASGEAEFRVTDHEVLAPDGAVDVLAVSGSPVTWACDLPARSLHVLIVEPFSRSQE